MTDKDYLYIRAARGERTERFPIWIMRQAGRYMKEYQKVKGKHTFMEMMQIPEVATEVTLQPIKAFGMDAAILFSDILVVSDAMGAGLDYIEQKGPVFKNPIQSEKDLQKMDPKNTAAKLDYVMQAIKLIKKELKPLNVPLIGFAGAPFTVASYMLGDGQGHDLKKFMKILFGQTPLVKKTLETLVDVTADYLNGQIKAGVDAIQIFDSWTNVLSWDLFKEFSLPYMAEVIKKLDNPKKIPITVFGTANSNFYPLLQDIGADVISFDSRIDILEARNNVRTDMAVQGNLDPHYLYAPSAVLKEKTMMLLNSMEDSSGFIFNLGHGVFPDVNESQIKLLVETVKKFENSPSLKS